MILVFAEKPSVGRSLAEFLGCKQFKDGCIIGASYTVTWGFGHLLNLANPEAYNWKKWILEDLPLIPDRFIYQPAQTAEKQLKLVVELMQKADTVINAADAGREGELIFRLIYNHSKSKAQVKRLWVSNTTDAGLKSAFNDLRPGADYESLFLSASCRQIADWLVGINATRALSLTANAGQVLSLGRVQTPVLAMICKRFVLNRDFVETVKYNIKADFKKDGIDFTAYHELGASGKQQASSLIGNPIKNPFEVVSIDSEIETSKPPLLFDLSQAQQFANKHYGLTAGTTLTILQELYERKLVTYPRTDSNYLNSTMKQSVEQIIEKLGDLSFVASTPVVKFPLSDRNFNDEKVSDHHAIIPTGETADIHGDVAVVYEMVIRRFLASFAHDRIREKKKIKLDSGGYLFEVKGVEVINAGWCLLEPLSLPKEVKLPSMGMHDKLKAEIIEPHEVKSKPPELYTDGTLLKAMENAGKDIEDEELSKAMKERGLGTPATRDSIIELLIKRGYIERKAKTLRATPLGLSVYDFVKTMELANPEMTGEWEMKLNKIYGREYGHNTFLEEIKSYTHDLVGAIVGSSQVIVRKGDSDTPCPVCNTGQVKEGKEGYYCSNYKQEKGGCRFSIRKKIAKKTLSPKVIETLISGKVTSELKGFKSKEDKPFAARLRYNKEKLAVEFVFEGR